MKNNFTCIIIDDEPKAIELLSDLIKEMYNNIEIIAAYTSWKTAIDPLRENNFDILFLDISMPQKNGLDILTLVPELKCEIIFVTAYSEFALNAFKFSAAGYLLKPVKELDLTKTIDKAITRITYKRLAEQNVNGITSLPKNKIGIPNKKGLDYVSIEDILYFEATKRYTKIVKKDTEFLSSLSIGRFKVMVKDYLFYQVHRSFIVNLNCICRYESIGAIIMSNGKEIPVSKNMKDDFSKIFETASRIQDTMEPGETM